MPVVPRHVRAPDTSWTVQPAADALILDLVELVRDRIPEVAAFATRLIDGAGIRLQDVIDHLVIPESDVGIRRLEAAGFVRDDQIGHACWTQRDGIFPDVVVAPGESIVLAMKVEAVTDFLAANQLSRPIDGRPLAPLRRSRVWEGPGAAFDVVERHGYLGLVSPELPAEQLLRAARHLETFRTRQRLFDDEQAGFDHTDALIDAAVQDLGSAWTCALFLRAEREYWERRNQAARVQKARQDALGIGWANDDHHTYDTSRQWFTRTIGTLERLGFVCRERFYAGAEAGWGSQILEHPVLGTVIFADLDLAPEELDGDFAHDPKPPLRPLRRAGLWCALHGESLLEAGINHLECMYDSKRLTSQLTAANVPLMAPFSDFPHLYQALTVGERWPVREARLVHLLAEGLITPAQAEEFRQNGAVGSHLENLERNQGYKGFNQPGISDVLRRIDPRVC